MNYRQFTAGEWPGLQQVSGHLALVHRGGHDAPGAERDEAQRLQRTGEWLHLWRVAGRYANVSVLDVDGHARLHEILSDLPLGRCLDIRVIPVTIHPSAISPGG